MYSRELEHKTKDQLGGDKSSDFLSFTSIVYKIITS
jgi:hypothetical protein